MSLPSSLRFTLASAATAILLLAAPGAALAATDCFSCHDRAAFQKRVQHQPVASGECVNATGAPQQAPIITTFFASAPSASGYESGIRYVLNYTTQNANRVEIFGNVMPDPAEGTFPIYDNQPSDSWVLWTANDQVWVEQSLLVQPDRNPGATLQNVAVNSATIIVSIRDPQFVDGDVAQVLAAIKALPWVAAVDLDGSVGLIEGSAERRFQVIVTLRTEDAA